MGVDGGIITGVIAALWLGVLTSISPCPLATNIAAVSFIGRNAGGAGRVMRAGGLYLLGRSLAYAAVAALVVSSILAIPAVSDFLQRHMNRALGPVLIVAGMFLLELIPLPFASGTDQERLKRIAERNLMAGSLLIGVLFALAFCPVSAALFFGSLIPLAVEHRSPLLLPALYGAGTALPVLTFGLILAFGTGHLSRAFNAVTRFELWARRVTGAIFILIGIYFTLTFIFNIQLW
ncbi:MAG: sulfite exporter TauE/SafE family protein [Spirochaetes bacterium]|nr:sulfite exporter TauE/SafE family protein [Spirochaetota bacterium]